MRRKIRPLIIGKDGAGKSWFAATFPKPMYVFLFDPPDKAGVYLERGEAGLIKSGKNWYYQDVFSRKDGQRIIHLEYWGEQNPNEPKTYMRFIGRTADLESELIGDEKKPETQVQTAVFDSATHFELMTRFYSENNINKYNKDHDLTREPRLHYGFSAHAIEQYIMTRWPNLIMCNAVMIGHPGDYEKVDDEQGEKVISVRTVEVPGKIGGKIGTSYSEVWRVYVDAQGERRLQTEKRAGNPYACKTSIKVPDGTYPHYEAVWQALEKAREEVTIIDSDEQRLEGDRKET